MARQDILGRTFVDSGQNPTTFESHCISLENLQTLSASATLSALTKMLTRSLQMARFSSLNSLVRCLSNVAQKRIGIIGVGQVSK